MTRSIRPPALLATQRKLRVGSKELSLFSGSVQYFRLPRRNWRRYLAEVHALGFSIIETYVPWRTHEQANGDFDFGQTDPNLDLGAFLDLIHELGLYAIVRPGPHINSEMTAFGLPDRVLLDRDCQARGPDGQAVVQFFPPRMFPIPSYFSHAFAQETDRWLAEVAKVVAPRVAPEGAVVMVQVDNEAAYYFRDGVYEQDYHPDAVAAYQTFLEVKYNTIDRCNLEYRRDAASFAEVSPPAAFRGDKDALALHLDWAEFREHGLIAALAKMQSTLRTHGLSNAIMSHNAPLGELGSALSIGQLSKEIAVVGMDFYHRRTEHDRIRRRATFLSGTTQFAYIPELGSGAPPWFPVLEPEDSIFTALVALAYGARGFNLYMAVDRDRWYGAPINMDGNPRLESAPWRSLLSALSHTDFPSLERHVDVGILIPREYLRLAQITQVLGPISNLVTDAMFGSPVLGAGSGISGDPGSTVAWQYVEDAIAVCDDLGLSFELVDSDAAIERWRRQRILVCPTLEFVDPERWHHMLDVARHGSELVVGPGFPTRDMVHKNQPFEVPARLTQAKSRPEIKAALTDLQQFSSPFECADPRIKLAVHSDEIAPRVLFVMNPTGEEIQAEITSRDFYELTEVFTHDEASTETIARLRVPKTTCRMYLVKQHRLSQSNSETGFAS